MSVAALGPQPAFMNQWPTAYLCHREHWTVAGPYGAWGALNPDDGTYEVVEPSADPELPALPAALQRGGLIGYRVGRRAIIGTASNFIKVVRPRRLERLVATHRSMAGSCSEVSFPEVIRSTRAGFLEITRVPGRSLHNLLRDPVANPTVLDTLDDIGSALAALHSTTPPPALLPRKIDTPARWINLVCRAEPDAGPELIRVADCLPVLAPTGRTVVHGDLHDKNIFASTNNVALIDLDGVGLGTAEDDVANLGVHLQLRSLQAGQHHIVGDEHAERLYRAYQSLRTLDRKRLNAVERHTWFRLACIYRFRRTSRHLVPELLRRAIG